MSGSLGQGPQGPKSPYVEALTNQLLGRLTAPAAQNLLGSGPMAEAEPDGAKALALMQALLPPGHHFVPVDHDPFADQGLPANG